MGVVAGGTGVIFILEGSMEVFFFGDTIMAVVTELGPRGWVGKDMLLSISFMTQLAGIIAFGERAVNSRSGAQVGMALLGQTGGPGLDYFRRLACLGESSRDLEEQHNRDGRS